jgi:hypothetical protein
MIGVDLNNVSVLMNGTNGMMSNCVSRIDSPAIDYAVIMRGQSNLSTDSRFVFEAPQELEVYKWGPK